MNTALIIICAVFCAAIILWAITHFGFGIALDKRFRDGIARRRHARRRMGGGQPTTLR
jgi:hypothetical protein